MARIYIKKGDLFEVLLGQGYKKFFQFLGNDPEQLNGNVIRIFSMSYPEAAYSPIEEIAQDSTECFLHTNIRVGVDFGFYKKVGNSKDLGNCDNIVFRTTDDFGADPPVNVSSKWYVWRYNGEAFFLGAMTPEYESAEFGAVLAPTLLIKRILYGPGVYRLPK